MFGFFKRRRELKEVDAKIDEHIAVFWRDSNQYCRDKQRYLNEITKATKEGDERNKVVYTRLLSNLVDTYFPILLEWNRVYAELELRKAELQS